MSADRRQGSSRALGDVDDFLSAGENQVETFKVGLERQGRIIYQCRWSLLKEESASRGRAARPEAQGTLKKKYLSGVRGLS